jgi:ribosomal protein L11 methylase PrmA
MDVASQLIEAIQAKRLALVAEKILNTEGHNLNEAGAALVRSGMSVCSSIRTTILRERDALCDCLDDAGIGHSADENELESPQIHQFSIALTGDNPGATVELLEKQGYRLPELLTGAQWQILRRTRDNLILTRVDEVTMRVRLSWRRTLPSGLVARAWPTVDDARLVPPGDTFWPLAFMARPFGILLRRLGFSGSQANIGEFLGTPEELVPLLLEFADISGDDIVYDLGCGDGRILIEAAKRFGCRAVGYEYDESLCEIARTKAESQGVSHLVEIHCADATRVEIDDATVVLLFLPPSTVAQLVPRLLKALPQGGRVVAHEQSPVNADPGPAQSRPLFGTSALTVAHLWTAEQL